MLCGCLLSDVQIVHTVPKHQKSSQARKVTGSLFGERFLGNGLVVIEDYETWRPRRKLYDPAFNKSYLKGLCPKFNSCVELFLDKLAPHATEVAFASDFDSKWNHMPLLLKHSGQRGWGYCLTTPLLECRRPFQSGRGGVDVVKNSCIRPCLHPFETRSYRETIRAMRSIGRECIRKRIRALDNGEDVPDDILTSILKVASNDAAADIETLVDDFVTFYIAENFDDPDTFNPSRFDPENPKPSPFVYFPFGVGHRSCIGKHLPWSRNVTYPVCMMAPFIVSLTSQIEAKIILARLFQTFKVSLPLGYKVEVMEKGTREPKGDVPCTLQCRSK
eukprot:Em0004g1071a